MHQSLIVCLAALPSLSSCSDVVTRTYATLDDARRDRLFERGWLPDILPLSARQIRVSSNLDINTADGEFSFDPAHFAEFTACLHPRQDGSFEFSMDHNKWVFTCDGSHTHCHYSMR
jgi:hypothetical protein